MFFRQYYRIAGVILLLGMPFMPTVADGPSPETKNKRTQARATEGKRVPALRDLILRISMEHPRIQSRARELMAALKRAKFSSWTYPDPRIGVFWLNGPYKRDLRFIRDQTPMTGIEYRLMQAIPFPGRLTVASKLADEDANIRRFQLALEKNRIVGEFLELLTRARAAHETIRLAESYAERMNVVADAARTRYAVGKGNLADVSRASLKAEAYRERIIKLKGAFDDQVARMTYYLVGDIDETKQKSVDQTAGKLIRELIRKNEPGEYVNRLRRNTPESAKDLPNRSLLIALSKTKITRAEKDRTLARMNYLPDFEVFAAYRKRAFIDNDPAQGENFMSFGVTIRVPLWSGISNTHRVAEKKARLDAARMNATDILRRETTMFEALKSRRRTAMDRFSLYSKRLIPTAVQARDSARLAYETGKVDFDVFLSSWDTLYMLEADRIRLQAAAHRQMILMALVYNEILPRVSVAKGDRK